LAIPWQQHTFVLRCLQARQAAETFFGFTTDLVGLVGEASPLWLLGASGRNICVPNKAKEEKKRGKRSKEGREERGKRGRERGGGKKEWQLYA
jgi:hypothetical protein